MLNLILHKNGTLNFSPQSCDSMGIYNPMVLGQNLYKYRFAPVTKAHLKLIVVVQSMRRETGLSILKISSLITVPKAKSTISGYKFPTI
jgi:hypothetical protein